MIVDSGACDHVVPKGAVPHVPVTKGKAAQSGVFYLAADGGRIPNLGEQKLGLRVGQERVLATFQVADVTTPILGVPRLTESGHDVRFHKTGGTITHMATGRVMRFQRHRGIYVLAAVVETEKAIEGRKAKEADSRNAKPKGVSVSSGTPGGEAHAACEDGPFHRPGR